MLIETRFTPEVVAGKLKADTSLAGSAKTTASSNQKVYLTYASGYFILQWSATAIDSYDWVGLYASVSAPDTDYIGGAWQWATSGSSYTTSQVMTPGYQARYLVWNASLAQYVSVARTDPFPPLKVCSTS